MFSDAERGLLALTDQFYDAASGAAAWSDVGRTLLRVFDAGTGTIMLGDAEDRGEVLFRGDLPLDAVTAYHQHYRKVDLWTSRAAAAALAGRARGLQVWTSGTLVPDDEFLGGEFYVDFGRRLGLRYVVGTVVPIDATTLMPIGLHRPQGSRPFERAHLQMLAAVLPHLRRAMQMRDALRPQAIGSASGLAALDAIEAGVVVVDADMRVLVSNAAAEALAGPDGPLRLRRAGSALAPGTVLGAAARGDEAALTRLVRATALTGAAGGALGLADSEGVRVVAAQVAPLPARLAEPGATASGRGEGRVRGRALVLLRDLRKPERPVSADLLCDLFALTRAEAEVARDLMGGATKESVAAGRGAQASTVRTQVRAILAKTSAMNLRDLERIIARLQ